MTVHVAGEPTAAQLQFYTSDLWTSKPVGQGPWPPPAFNHSLHDLIERTGGNAFPTTGAGSVRSQVQSKWQRRLSRALLLAAAKPDFGVASVTLQQGADANAQEAHTGSTALHLAARAGCPELVHEILRFDADPGIQDRNGDLPIDVAIKNRQSGCVVELLLQGGDTVRSSLDLHKHRRWYALMAVLEWCCLPPRRSHVELVADILNTRESESAVNQVFHAAGDAARAVANFAGEFMGGLGITARPVAAAEPKGAEPAQPAQVVRSLSQRNMAGAASRVVEEEPDTEPAETAPPEDWFAGLVVGDPPDEEEKPPELDPQKPRIFFAGVLDAGRVYSVSECRRALFLCTAREWAGGVAALVEADVDVNIRDPNAERTALELAIAMQNTQMVTVLRNHGASEKGNPLFEESAFILAASRGDMHCLEYWFTRVKDVNCREPLRGNRPTALMYAATEGNKQVAARLLEMRADPAMLDARDRTCAERAEIRGHKGLAKLLRSVAKRSIMSRLKAMGGNTDANQTKLLAELRPKAWEYPPGWEAVGDKEGFLRLPAKPSSPPPAGRPGEDIAPSVEPGRATGPATTPPERPQPTVEPHGGAAGPPPTAKPDGVAADEDVDTGMLLVEVVSATLSQETTCYFIVKPKYDNEDLGQSKRGETKSGTAIEWDEILSVLLDDVADEPKTDRVMVQLWEGIFELFDRELGRTVIDLKPYERRLERGEEIEHSWTFQRPDAEPGVEEHVELRLCFAQYEDDGE